MHFKPFAGKMTSAAMTVAGFDYEDWQ